MLPMVEGDRNQHRTAVLGLAAGCHGVSAGKHSKRRQPMEKQIVHIVLKFSHTSMNG